MVHTCSPSTQGPETGWLLRVEGQPWVHTKYRASRGYIIRPYLKKIIKKNISPLNLSSKGMTFT